MTSYEIGAEYQAWEKLVNEMFIDPETGESREPTDEDKKYLQDCFNEIIGDAETKFNNMGYLIRNFELDADLIKAQKDVFYSEVERLRKKITTCENKVKSIKGVAAYLLEKLDVKKFKTSNFNCYWQATQKSVKTDYQFDIAAIPICYTKMELNHTAIKEAIKDGFIYEKDDPMLRGKLFYTENKVEKELIGVSYLGGQTLVLR